MARVGLDKAEVKKASEQLVAKGRYPSVDAVRIALGNTGSKTTIHKYLKELESEAGKVTDRQTKTARSLQDFVEELAAKLHADADARIEEVRAGYEATLQTNAEHMVTMQRQIETLRFQLRQAETLARNLEWAHDLQLDSAQKASKPPGFGIFGSLMGNSRTGKQGWSKFNLRFNTRTSLPADDQPSQGGYDVLSHI